MLYVGLDAHWRQSTLCVLDGQGHKILSRTVHGRWPEVLEEVGKVGRPFAVCFEASTGYGYLYDGLRKMTRRVVVAHPGQLRLIFRSKRKNDRADAEKLAKLLYLDAVPPIHVPSSEIRSWRRMIGHRQKLIGDRARVKNGIRAMLRSQGISAPRGLWSRRGEEWLETVELSTELDMVQRDVLLERLRATSAMIERVERVLNQVGSRHPGVALLKTIPGVGDRTAEAVVAWVDDPWRFRRVSRIGSYFGVVPSQDASGSVNRLGHITREGPSVVRGLLAEAAWQAIRRSDRVRRGDDERRKIALVATVHYLLRVMLTMLQSGEAWRAETEVATAEAGS